MYSNIHTHIVTHSCTCIVTYVLGEVYHELDRSEARWDRGKPNTLQHVTAISVSTTKSHTYITGASVLSV